MTRSKQIGCLCSRFVLLFFFQIGQAQSLEVTTEQVASGEKVISINYQSDRGNIVALQFDLRISTQRFDTSRLEVVKGRSLSAAHGFGFKQLQPGLLRVVVYPPIQKNMPSLASGQLARLRFPGLKNMQLRDDDIQFVPRSILLSNTNGQVVSVRETRYDLMGRGNRRP